MGRGYSLPRWIDALVNLLLNLVGTLGYWGIFLAHFAESAWVPITSEIFLLFAGFLVLKGRFNFWGIVLAACAGFALGSLIPFLVARYGGLPLIYRYGQHIHFGRKRLRRVQRWFDRYGEWVVLATRSVPVVRNFITLPAGLSRMNLVKFILYTLVGFFHWSIFVTYLGVKMGQKWDQVIGYLEQFGIIILISLGLAGLLWLVKFRRRRAVQGGE